MSVTENFESFKEAVRSYGAKTLQSLLSAFLIWLFGVLVFIPISNSLGSEVKLLCTLIIFIAFTAVISQTFVKLKRLIDTFSIVPAQKYFIKRGWNTENGVEVSKQVFYSIFAIVLFLFYFPLLMNLHPALSGIALILTIGFVLFSAIKAFGASMEAINHWLNS